MTGEELQEDGGVHDKVAAATKAQQGDEDAEGRPVRHGAGHDTAGRADEEGDVEGILATDCVGAETPEQGARQHAHIGSNR